MGIEGRRDAGASSGTMKSQRRASAMSRATGKAMGVRVNSRQVSASSGLSPRRAKRSWMNAPGAAGLNDARPAADVPCTHGFPAIAAGFFHTPSGDSTSSPRTVTVYLSPRDVMSFELGPLSRL